MTTDELRRLEAVLAHFEEDILKPLEDALRKEIVKERRQHLTLVVPQDDEVDHG